MPWSTVRQLKKAARKKLLVEGLAWLLLLGSSQLWAGTVSGQISTASNGRPVANSTLTFTLSQNAIQVGTAALTTTPVYCWTDSFGNVVGLPGDQAVAVPALSSTIGIGSLASGTYYVRYTWLNSTGESQASSERSLVLSATGTLILAAPSSVPPTATQMRVYISSTAGTETLQGSVAVTNGILASAYSQATALVGGAALPASNSSRCKLAFNDELIPSFTNYSTNLLNVTGAQIAGFPQKWYLRGGSAGTVNVANGTPLFNGVVIYPQAIVSSPANNAPQSIGGPLNLNTYSITNTAFNGLDIMGSLQAVGQTTSLASTPILTIDGVNGRQAGLYILSSYVNTSVAGTGTTMTYTVTFTDSGGAKSQASGTIDLSTVGNSGFRSNMLVMSVKDATSVQVFTTVGSIGTSKYDYRFVIARYQ